MAAPDHQTAFAWTQSRVSAPVTSRDDGGARAPEASPAPAKPQPPPAAQRSELPPDGELWDVDDAARFLKMSTSWVYKRVEAGVLPCVRVDGWSLRFVPVDLRAWAAKQPARRRVRRAATTRT